MVARVVRTSILAVRGTLFQPRATLNVLFFFRWSATERLLQLRVLGLGLLQNGDVGVGIFPESEEILIRSSRFRQRHTRC